MKTDTHELEHVQHRSQPVKHIAGGFLVGSVIGATTALLFAPRSGEETRAEIREKAVELKDNVLEKADEIKQRGKDAVSKQLERVSHTAEIGKEKVQEY